MRICSNPCLDQLSSQNGVACEPRFTTEATKLLQVTLVAHSAGGWLARAFVADPLYFASPAADPSCPHAGVAAIVTLGSPQSPPAPGLGRDVTGACGWLTLAYYAHNNCSSSGPVLIQLACAGQSHRLKKTLVPSLL